MLAQFRRVLLSNEFRTDRTGAGQCIKTPASMSILPPDEACGASRADYIAWAKTVWAGENHGIVQAFAHLQKKRRKVAKLLDRAGTFDSLLPISISFYSTRAKPADLAALVRTADRTPAHAWLPLIFEDLQIFACAFTRVPQVLLCLRG